MTRPLTEAQAWREVARRFVENAQTTGLCGVVFHLSKDRVIDGTTHLSMVMRLRDYLLGMAWGYPPVHFMANPEDAPARALAALWLACEAEAGE